MSDGTVVHMSSQGTLFDLFRGVADILQRNTPATYRKVLYEL